MKKSDHQPKGGADFKKCGKTSPSFQVGVRGMNKKTRLIHARSKKNERYMSRKLIG